MKICWDNIENIRLTKKGNFYNTIKKKIYYYHISCKTCKEPFLGNKDSKYCCGRCSQINRKRPERSLKIKGKNNPNWNGGYYRKNIPVYDTYAPQIEWAEEVRRNKEDPNILEVKCFKCNKWYVPTRKNVRNKIGYFLKYMNSESNFYCSKECKNSCSIFGKTPEALMKEDAIRAGRLPWLVLTREIQPELRQMVLERDKHKCVKCNSEKDLQCHHILPVNIEPLLSTDIDNCITLCSKCHKKVHQEIDGCGYGQLRNIGIC